jgi:hypothetical protein
MVIILFKKKGSTILKQIAIWLGIIASLLKIVTLIRDII